MVWLSIVIAAHNAEAFLANTLSRLSSEVASVSGDLEVLLLEDGSTDATAVIADEFAAQVAWLTVQHVDFRNIGQVRQYGVDAASGRYIVFLDSDDAFMDGALAWLLKVLKQQQPDVLLAPLQEVYDDLDAKHVALTLPVCSELTCAQAVDGFIEHKEIQGHLIGKCFARYLLLAHPIPPLSCYEDMAVLPEILCASQSTLWADKPFYLYRKHPGSLSDQGRHWSRLREHIQALELIEHSLRGRIPTHRLSTAWLELANNLVGIEGGRARLLNQESIVKRIAGVPLWRYFLDPKTRFSRKRMLLRLRLIVGNR